MKRGLFEQAIRASRRNPLAVLRTLAHLPRLTRLYWRIFRDPRTGLGPRLVLLATLAYVISPIDILPVLTFGPLGLMDDLTLFLFGCQTFLRLVPDPVLQEHLAATAAPDKGPSV